MPIISAITFNLNSIFNVVRTIIDLILVWYVIYVLVSMMRQNMRTMQLFKGVLLILILKMFTSLLGLSAMDYLVDTVLTWGVVAIIVVFQPEIRGLLEKIGRTKLEIKHDNLSDDEKERLMDELVGAITKLSEDQTGALITFERNQSLIDYINTGTKINADIKSELFTTIFWEGTPLHDGAMIIKDDRIICAAAFYPPTSQELSPLYGARHRAALGISEITDSLTVVVSEETGTISFATSGKLRKIPRKELRASLVNELDWFNSKEKDGEKDDKKDSHKPSIKKDSTTDFFLNFITRQKSENKKSDKQLLIKNNEDTFNVKDKAFEILYKTINSLNLFLDRMLQSNLSMKVFSFIMAVVLLFTINGNINNIFSTPNGGDYIYDVKIDARGLQDDFDVVGLPETVNVALVGPSLDIYTAKIAKNYKIIADFSSLGEGDHTVELKSEGFPSDLQVMIVPQAVNVKITQKITKTFELGYNFLNEEELDNKYSVSVESMEHQQVEVRGSQDVIGKINAVKAAIDLKGIKGAFEQKAKIYAYDRSGKKLDVEIIPNTVKVQCDVSSYSKEVSILPQYTGHFESGYGLESITLSKEKVRIYGKEELLNSVNNVFVNIDISGLSGDKSYSKLPISRNDKINKLSYDTVDVSIRVSPAMKKVINDIPINIINNEGNYRVIFSDGQDKAAIEVEAVEEKLNNVTPNDFVASINLEDLKNGSNTVKVDLNTNKGYLSYKLASPEKITITLRK